MKTTTLSCAFILCFALQLLGQTATVQGVILDDASTPILGVNIRTANNGTQTDINGYYGIEIPSGKEVEIIYSHVGFKNISIRVNLKPNDIYEFNPVFKADVEQISTVVITTGQRERQRVEGVISLEPETVRKIPGANAGVENLLKILPGVSGNNELSTQYTVRGGNFDENLVYVNEIEVYRPFLIRSGQQEGLSFVNSDLTRNVEFSAGGFQAKYGDKLSSVLDITYRRPVDFGASFEASLLGGSVSVEGVSKEEKFSGIVGLRYRDNGLLVNSRQTETNYRAGFADAQTYLSYRFSKKFELGFLGNVSVNNYNFEPEARQTNFGTLQDPVALVVFYDGQEEDRYETYFGALKATYDVSDNYTAKLIASAYNTQEQEHFDIFAEYRLGVPNTDIGSNDLGDVEFTRAAGSQLTHARNDLDALIFNFEHKGQVSIEDHLFDYGVKYTHEDIRDRQQEYEVVDSAGFAIRPPFGGFANDQPYEAFDAPLVPFTSIRAFNETQIDRLQAYAQYGNKTNLGDAEVFYNIGLRAHQWTVNDARTDTSESQAVVSPRAQFAIKPAWKQDMVFRVSGGLYHQPPFYRELRDSTGTVQAGVKAQQSIHVVLGHDWSFNLWERPFKLVSELYYKKLDDVNPYTIENVRIRYRARNNAVAYAYGFDARLNGEFVPGTESWVSFGYLKTEENIDDRGFIARPTDQRLKFGVLVQDYVPRIPSLKMYLNLVYNTGLPGGSPSYADPYDFQRRLRDYRRADLGIFYVFTDEKRTFAEGHWLHKFKELTAGFEIFNIFDVQNSITNTFVRDASSQQQFAIPNFLTPRIFNVKVGMRF